MITAAVLHGETARRPRPVFIFDGHMTKTKVLRREFFDRPAPTVARDLLGKYLVRRLPAGRQVRDGGRLALMITEVEAYEGWEDKASHASRGRTERNAPMFGPAGRWYVYFVYGIHWMLNVVTGAAGHPAAVLIRGLDGISGPARLTKSLGIDRRLNGRAALPREGLWIEDRGVVLPPRRVGRGPRVGVAYAGDWAKKPYRYFLKT